MKFKVWEEPKERYYYLQLVERPSGIYLHAVRPDGDLVSSLFRIHGNKISRCSGVESCLGFALDNRNKIILES